jgi:hypothetical protein
LPQLLQPGRVVAVLTFGDSFFWNPLGAYHCHRQWWVSFLLRRSVSADLPGDGGHRPPLQFFKLTHYPAVGGANERGQ